MTIVDSVGWLAFFLGEPLRDAYRPHLLRPGELLCPTVILYEVTRQVRRCQGDRAGRLAAGLLRHAQVVPLDAEVALEAARVGLQHHLALADSVIYATALRYQAALITSDVHFEGLPLVTYLPRP